MMYLCEVIERQIHALPPSEQVVATLIMKP